MSTVAPPNASVSPDWSRLVPDSIKQYGVWHTYLKLVEPRGAYPDDLSLRRYTEIVRNNIVRDVLANLKAMNTVLRLSAAFLTNVDRFHPTPHEGYMISLIHGRM